jgi:uncharacterized membrane protein YkvA (DUF1232 family)
MQISYTQEAVAVTLKERAGQLKTDIPAVMLCLRRRETPLAAKLLAAVTVAYALSPVDLIPDFIPVLGYLDDLILLPALIALTVRLLPPGLLDECRREAEGARTDGKKRWYFAVPVVLVWLVVVWLVVKAVFLKKAS